MARALPVGGKHLTPRRRSLLQGEHPNLCSLTVHALWALAPDFVRLRLTERPSAQRSCRFRHDAAELGSRELSKRL